MPAPSTAPTEWGTIAEAADRLRVHPRTVRRMISRGEILAERIGPRLIRVDMSSLGGRPLQYVEGAVA